MSEFKGTPGPREVCTEAPNSEWRGDGTEVLSVPMHCRIAETHANFLAPDHLARANAHLIAAAPELLEAAQGLLKALPSSTTHPAIATARAAIAKALGGQP